MGCLSLGEMVEMIYELENESDFEKFLDDNENVLVDFYAEWCNPCSAMSTILPDVAESSLFREKDIKILKVDVDKFEGIYKGYNVRSLPTIMLFQTGLALATKTGVQNKDTIVWFVEENV